MFSSIDRSATGQGLHLHNLNNGLSASLSRGYFKRIWSL